MSKGISISGRIVDGHARDSQAIAAVNANGLHRRVLDVEVGDGRVDQIVGVEKFGLGHATVPLAVPPCSTVAVKIGAAGPGDSNACAADLEQWAVPFFEGPGRFTLKDDLFIQLALH